MSDSNEGRVLSRRNLLVLGAGAGLVSACGAVAHADGGTGGDAMNADDTAATDDAMTADDAMAMDDTAAVTCDSTLGTQLGTVADYPEGTWTTESSVRAIVAHDAGGLYAYSNLCTHESCAVGRPSATGVTVCPCHFSRFDGNGAVIQGPAVRPLAHFQVTVCDGNVFVLRSRTVPASTRTPV